MRPDALAFLEKTRELARKATELSRSLMAKYDDEDLVRLYLDINAVKLRLETLP